MSQKFADRLRANDFVWTALSAALGRHAPRARSTSGFVNICCPLCVARGQASADRRFRCGIRYDASGIGVCCFNCGLKTRYQVGERLGRAMQEFLVALGVDETEVRRLAYRADQVHRLLDYAAPPDPHSARRAGGDPTRVFPARALPDQAASLAEWAARGCDDADFRAVVAYLASRGEEIAAASPYYWTPTRRDQLHHRLIIPCWHAGVLVGWIARDVTDTLRTRYYSEIPSGMLFNSAAMLEHPWRAFVVLVEGPFDALAIDAVAALGSSLSLAQADWLAGCGRRVVVVPDRDPAGIKLTELARRRGWDVAFPRLANGIGGQWWDPDVKDAAQATARYGRLYTLRSILASRVADPQLIDQRARLLF